MYGIITLTDGEQGVYNRLWNTKYFRFHETILRTWLDPYGFTNIWLIFMMHAGKYTSPIECLVIVSS